MSFRQIDTSSADRACARSAVSGGRSRRRSADGQCYQEGFLHLFLHFVCLNKSGRWHAVPSTYNSRRRGFQFGRFARDNGAGRCF